MKRQKKVRVYFSMNCELHKKLENHIVDKTLDRSKLIEKLISEYLDKIA